MKPYPSKNLSEERRIFNYRLSRARRISEKVFGLQATRFRVFHTMISLKPESVIKVILACCSMHNFLMKKSPNAYAPLGSVDTDVSGEVQQSSRRMKTSQVNCNLCHETSNDVQKMQRKCEIFCAIMLMKQV